MIFSQIAGVKPTLLTHYKDINETTAYPFSSFSRCVVVGHQHHFVWFIYPFPFSLTFQRLARRNASRATTAAATRQPTSYTEPLQSLFLHTPSTNKRIKLITGKTEKTHKHAGHQALSIFYRYKPCVPSRGSRSQGDTHIHVEGRPSTATRRRDRANTVINNCPRKLTTISTRSRWVQNVFGYGALCAHSNNIDFESGRVDWSRSMAGIVFDLFTHFRSVHVSQYI